MSYPCPPPNQREPIVRSLNATPADWLPNEIYQHILDSLPDCSSQRVQTLLACRLACSHLKVIAELPVLWAREYKLKWTYHDPAREAERTAQYENDWFQRYVHRSWSDHEVLVVLRQMATQRKGRHVSAQRVYRVYGSDAWDMLEKYANQDPPDELDDSSCWISTSFWAGELLRAIHRAASLERLYRLKDGQNMELEEGLSTLDGFFGVPYEKLKRSFDLMAERCKSSLTPGIEDDTPAMCIAICDWMRSQGFGPAEGDRYLAIQNHFIHKVLESRTSLPLTLVAIFVAIARRLGLDAHPVSFPAHVHAWVRVKEHIPKEDEEQQHVSIDVFHSASQPILTSADLDPILQAMGTTAQEHPELLAPASTAEMVMRAARNVANSLRQGGRNAIPDMPWRYWTVITACYAMVTTITLLSPAHQADHFFDLAMHVKERIRHVFPMDIAIIVELTIMPNMGPLEQEPKEIFQSIIDLNKQAEDAPPRPVTRRDPAHNVKYFVGLVVALSGSGADYMGVITGWNIDGSYKTEDGTTSSPSNPIYQITYTTTAWTNPRDSQTRYDLQSNVRAFSISESSGTTAYPPQPTTQGWGLYFVLKSIVWDLGRIFRSAVNGKRGHLWFVPAEDLATEYPDDVGAGRDFLKDVDEDAGI